MKVGALLGALSIRRETQSVAKRSRTQKHEQEPFGFPHLGTFVVGVVDSLVVPLAMPVGVAAVAHEATHIIWTVLCGWTRLAKLTH